jgi:pimeloyl-ACP methyl ester carboxylesterase/DNA-binding CsgD family transcriptional regulator
LKIAYQVVGQGSLDLVLVPGFISNLDVLWELPGYERLVRRLAAIGRIILFDKPGTGLSDRLDPSSLPDLDRRSEDILAVLNAAGSNNTVLLGSSDGAALAIRFAVNHPARARALILHGTFAKFIGPVMDSGKLGYLIEVIDSSWGTGATVPFLAPNLVSDSQLVEWWARFERLSASPTAAHLLMNMTGKINVTDDLGRIHCPVLVIHRVDDPYVRASAVRDLAKRIPGSRLVELQGRDHPIWLGDTNELVDEVAEFLTGERPKTTGNFALAAILAGHVMGPTKTAGSGRDSLQFGERLEQFQEVLPGLMGQFDGQVRWTSTNDVVARFKGTTQAVACAVAIRDTAARSGLAFGLGIHVGEVDVDQTSLAGPSLDIAVRIAAATRPAEILLSQLASQFVSRSGLQFMEHRAIGVDEADDPIPVIAIATERYMEPMRHRLSTADLGALSLRERQVLALVAEGMINSVIAVQLGLSQHTVKRHVANILLKLDLPTRAAAAALMARQATG